jgi:hypothetical protein
VKEEEGGFRKEMETNLKKKGLKKCVGLETRAIKVRDELRTQ